MSSINRVTLFRRVAALALGAAAVWLLVRIGVAAWELARSEPYAALPERPAGPVRQPAADAPGSRLFGTAPARGGGDPAPRLLANGDFRLRAAVASAHETLAHAIIESSGSSKAYFSGDALASGLTVDKVLANEVILKRGSETLRLPLSGREPPGGSAGAADRRPEALAGGASGAMEPAGLLPGATRALDRAPRQSLPQLVRMEPVMDAEGAMEGYRIFPRQRAVFDRLGLVPGDLVVAVNGIPIAGDSMQQARNLISGAADLTLTIARGGEQLEITVGSENFGLLAM